jgi:tetratricopeptide (TPR) repeat protein
MLFSLRRSLHRTGFVFLVCFSAAILWSGLVAASELSADTSTREAAFLKANELFDQADSPDDYRAAARMLESIVTDGYQNGAVYYNLGNAWFRAGEYGRAILNYRKAMPWRPRDPYLAANLQQALQRAPGRLPEQPAPLRTRVLFWSSWYSFPTKVKLSCAGFVLTALITLTAVLLRKPRLHLMSAAGLVLSGLLAADVALSYDEVYSSSRAVITRETVARKGTGKDYEPAFDQPLKDGAEFTVLSETAGWTFGHFEGIGDGWIRNEDIAR